MCTIHYSSHVHKLTLNTKREPISGNTLCSITYEHPRKVTLGMYAGFFFPYGLSIWTEAIAVLAMSDSHHDLTEELKTVVSTTRELAEHEHQPLPKPSQN